MKQIGTPALSTGAGRGRLEAGSAADRAPCRRSVVLVTALLALCATPAMASEQPTLAERTEMYFRYLEIGDRVKKLGLLEPRWLADGNRFWYAAGAPEETVIYLVDPVANTRVELFDTGRVRALLEEHLGHPPPHRGLPFEDFTFVGFFIDIMARSNLSTGGAVHYRVVYVYGPG